MASIVGNTAPERAGGRYDAVVVGAGTAGLSAALVLGRSRRHVLVVDGGQPRNAPSSGIHYFLTRDGTPPGEFLAIAREQLEPYAGVEVRKARAVRAGWSGGDFEVALEDGSTVGTRRILLATGVHDDLPERPGFRELWGRSIFHCPYCHGWEVRDRPLAVLTPAQGAVEYAALIRNWSRDLVVLTDGAMELDAQSRSRLDALGMPVKEERILRLEGDGGGGLRRIFFEDGSEIEREGLFCAPPQRQRSDLAKALGCETEAMGPIPEVVKSDPTTHETTVEGVFVAGDAGTMKQGAIMAASSGAVAAASINRSLVLEEVETELATPTAKA